MRNIGITGAYCKNLKIKKKSISAYLEQANELAGLYKKNHIMSTSAKAKEVTQTDIIWVMEKACDTIVIQMTDGDLVEEFVYHFPGWIKHFNQTLSDFRKKYIKEISILWKHAALKWFKIYYITAAFFESKQCNGIFQLNDKTPWNYYHNIHNNIRISNLILYTERCGTIFQEHNRYKNTQCSIRAINREWTSEIYLKLQHQSLCASFKAEEQVDTSYFTRHCQMLVRKMYL